MRLFNNVKSGAWGLAESAKKNVDVKRLELAIKSVRKENTLLYAQIGKLVYSCKKSGKAIAEREIEDLCARIDGNRIKVADLEDKINRIEQEAQSKKKTGKAANKANAGIKPDKADFEPEITVAPIAKNERDLRLMRTEQGVRFMRFCPKCGGANEPESKICASCGCSFADTADMD